MYGISLLFGGVGGHEGLCALAVCSGWTTNPQNEPAHLIFVDSRPI